MTCPYAGRRAYPLHDCPTPAIHFTEEEVMSAFAQINITFDNETGEFVFIVTHYHFDESSEHRTRDYPEGLNWLRELLLK